MAKKPEDKKLEELSAEERAALKEVKTTHGVTEAELADLSDEERAAIEEEDGDAENLREIAAEDDGDEAKADAAKAKVKPGPGDESDDDDEDAETAEEKAAREKQEAKAAAMKAAETKASERAEELAAMSDEDRAEAKAADKAEAAKATAEEAAEAGDDGEIDVPMRPRMPRLTVKPVEKYGEQMTALDTEYDALLKTFKEGDMPIEDLLSKQRALDNKRFDLREAKGNADRATDHNQQIGQAEWMGDVQDFFGVVNEKEGIDYTKRALNVAFDDALKSLAAVPENNDKSESWYLRQAHKMIKADLGLVAKPEPKAGDKEKGKIPGRKPKFAIVPDLGKLPSAGDGEDGEDAPGGDPEFAQGEKLVGQEYEDWLARMSPAKQEKFLRSR